MTTVHRLWSRHRGSEGLTTIPEDVELHVHDLEPTSAVHVVHPLGFGVTGERAPLLLSAAR